ncbi:beta-N-acetylhexosaminidase [Sphingobacterium sp. SGG-5]|uniref:beta-N-acetylhexosaminidase n=1 Tax=Sphingobacterium sp. SGG-5 TaxID=2710881 RepID=UPI0013ED4ADA|nr:beta-N-acetylhexosaminidase [Sphingobacterium sp. SGG-5]NGM60884.1 beta-N-acetylhexosaminidase [Sphingobacterium sp. SGG-5]
MKKYTSLVLCLLFVALGYIAEAQVPIIPYPNKVEIKEGTVDLAQGARVTGTSKYKPYLQKMLTTEFGLPANKGVVIKLTVKPDKNSNPEAYALEIKDSGIEIKAVSETGIFYGIQSLKQLLLQDKRVPLLSIQDKPSFKWRSFMLDEARYFQGKETVKKLLDDMALLKLNKFHWHLTNDAGWRIQIKSFPLLTEIGSKRDSSQINDNGKKWKSTLTDHREHSGFYTQEEIKEIIAYAAERQIEIIPEISMPGHVSAAVASYPFLGTTKKPIQVPVYFGVVSAVLDVSDPQALSFIHQVLREVAQLFPSNYIHIGGDEVKFDQWKESKAVQQYMEESKIENYYDLQVHFTNSISKFVQDSLNKRIIGWNEILGKNVHEWAKEQNANESLSKTALVQFWKGDAKDLLFGIERGHEIINSDHKFTYLDYTYKQISLEKAYSFNPVPDGITPEQQQLIVGLGAQMWGEWTPSVKEIQYQAYPRIAAYAETGWTDVQHKDYARFEKNIQQLVAYWKSKGYNLPTGLL